MSEPSGTSYDSVSHRAGGDPEWQILADALPGLVSYLVREDGEVRYRFANRNYATWFSIGQDEIVGRRLRDVIGEAAYRAVESFVERAFSGERITFEQHMPYKDGPSRDVRIASVPRASAAGVEGVYTLVEDVTQARKIEAELRESEEDYRHAAALNPQVAWTARPDGELDRVAPRWLEWTGTNGLGSSYAEGLHPEDVEPTFAVWRQAVATGEPYDIVHRIRRTDGEFRWARSRAFPRRDAGGAIVRWYGTTEDIHEQKIAEDRLRLLVLELNHRVKNNLATVQAIAMQTLRGSAEAEATRHAMTDRLAALAAAHDILTREQWEGAGVSEVAHGVLAPLAGASGRIAIRGPARRLTSQTALSLAMAFHELGTNALKYGALSNETGTVDLSWATGPDGKVTITWLERGGPAVASPARRGFGTRLLERGVAHELKADVRLDFQPQGLMCSITAELREPSQAAGGEPATSLA